jgi:hypothetical protein
MHVLLIFHSQLSKSIDSHFQKAKGNQIPLKNEISRNHLSHFQIRIQVKIEV